MNPRFKSILFFVMDPYLSISCKRSSNGSPFGILDVKSGGMESCEGLELVLMVLAKLLGTKPGLEKEAGKGDGVGETPSLPGDLDSSLRAPGLSLPSSLGLLDSSG